MIASGRYRASYTVAGALGVATVRRKGRKDSPSERYLVRLDGEPVAICWRYGVGAAHLDFDTPAPRYDGGWTRAVALADYAATGDVCAII